MRTEAESLFEQFCSKQEIAWRRIAEATTRTPDYEIVVEGVRVVVEVKQLEPNAEDLAFLEELRTKGWAGRSINMGRARAAIRDGVRQLRAYSSGRDPGVVLLHDTVGPATAYLDPYSLAYCLYGAEKIHFEVAPNPADDIDMLGMSRGGGSVATSEHNTTLSALAVFRWSGQATPGGLDVYHNIHAAIPLKLAEPVKHGIRQFKFEASEPGRMPDWMEF
jgi:hypothetical protein